MNDNILIESVQNFPNLFDKNRTDFKDESKKERAWTEIATEVGCTASDAKSRFRTLRERLVRERKKMKEVGESEPSSWEPYLEMSWLLPYLGNPRKRSSSKIFKGSPTHVQYNGDEEVVDGLEYVSVDNVDSNGSYDSPSTPRLCTFTLDRKQNTSQVKATVASSLNSIANYVKEHIVPLPAKVQRSTVEDDVDDAFGRLVACELKYCKDKKRKQIAKKKITDILFDLQ